MSDLRERAEKYLARLKEQARFASRQLLGPPVAVGLDIGADSVKAAQVVDLGDRLEVSLFAMTPLREDSLAGGDAVAFRVRDLIHGWGFKGRRLVAGLPGQQCLLRRVKLPFADRKKAAKVLPFEMEHDVPVPVEELVLELFPFAANGHRPQAATTDSEGQTEQEIAASETPPEEAKAQPAGPVSYLALGTTREQLKAWLDLLTAAGVEPRVVESDVLALYQAYAALRPAADEGEGIRLVLDIGAQKSTLLLVRAGRLVAARAIPMAGDSLTRALSAAWQVPFEQAEQIKRERCSLVLPGDETSPRRQAASDLLKQSLRPLILELRRSLMAWTEELECKGALPEVLYLSGGTSLLPNLDGHLSAELGVPVRGLASTPMLEYASGGDRVDDALIPTALGLALRSLRRVSPVDFRRLDLLPTREVKGLKTTLIGVGAALVLALALGLYDLNERVSSKQARVDLIKGRMEQIYRQAVPGKGSVPDPIRLLRLKFKEAQAEIPGGSFLGGPAYPDLSLVRRLSEEAGGGKVKVKLTRLLADPLRVELEGEADSTETVTRFRMVLLKTGLFKECKVIPGSGSPNGKAPFKMELKRQA